jgi:hypothetical protein
VATPAKSIAKKPVAGAPPAKAPARSAPVTNTGTPPESLPHKIAHALGAVVDVFTDAERLHHKLDPEDPDISNEPE